MPTLIDNAAPNTTSNTTACTIQLPAAHVAQSTSQDLPTLIDNAAPDTTSNTTACTIQSPAAHVA